MKPRSWASGPFCTGLLRRADATALEDRCRVRIFRFDIVSLKTSVFAAGFGRSVPVMFVSQQSIDDRDLDRPREITQMSTTDLDHPDYEIIKELGRGGMGVVYLAHNKLMGRLEVLKVVDEHLIEQPGVVDRFRREIRSAAQLRHPDIRDGLRGDANRRDLRSVDGIRRRHRSGKARQNQRSAPGRSFLLVHPSGGGHRLTARLRAGWSIAISNPRISS